MTLIMFGLMAGCFAAGAIWWRSALIWVFIMLCVEGLPRLWIGDPQILLAKDALVSGIYAGFGSTLALRRVGGGIPRVLAYPVLTYALIVCLELFNPGLSNYWVGLVGLKSTLFYLPLIVVTPAALADPPAAHRFIEQILFMSVPVCIVGLVQGFLGPEFYSGLGSGFGDALFVTGGHIDPNDHIYRPNSTFAWSGHYGAFLLFSCILSSTVALVPQARRRRWLFVVIAVINLMAAMTSGQRALFLHLPAALLVVSVFQGFRFRRTFLSAGLAFTGVTLTLLLTGPFVIDRFRSLFDDPTYSLVGPYTDAIRGNLAIGGSASVLGAGLGTATPASRHVGNYVFIESYYGKTLYELGWPGMGALVWLLSAIQVFGWASRRKIGDLWLRGVASAIFACNGLVAVWGLVVGTLDFPVFAIPFWVLTGVLVRVSSPELSLGRAVPVIRVAALERALNV